MTHSTIIILMESKLKFEIIPQELYLEFFAHEVLLPETNETITTTVFVSRGLRKCGQKELLAVMKDGFAAKDDLLQSMSMLIKTIHQLATQGRIVDAGDFTQFGQSDMFGWKGIVYADTEVISELPLDEPTLVMLFLSLAEVQAVQAYGALRILSMLGKKYRYYPNPYWNELDRDHLPTQAMQERSLVSRIGGKLKLSGAHITLHNDQITLQVPKSIQVNLPPQGIPTDQPVAILPGLNKMANGCLTFAFDDHEQGPEAITPPDSNGSHIGGCVIIAGAGQPAYSARIAEDGFALLFTNDQWQDWWQAFKAKEDFAVPAANMGFKMQFF